MPELPEVEALADHLRRHAVGATISRVDVVALSVLKTFDPPVDALVLRDAVTSEPVAALVGHACHPVVLDATNTRVTADYVHFLRRELEDAWGCPVVFLTGAAGDVNTGHSAEASYSGVRAAGRTFEGPEPKRPSRGRSSSGICTAPLSQARQARCVEPYGRRDGYDADHGSRPARGSLG